MMKNGRDLAAKHVEISKKISPVQVVGVLPQIKDQVRSRGENVYLTFN